MKADALARLALTCLPKVTAPKIFQNRKNAIGIHFRAIHQIPHPACVTHGLTREEATLLYRTRTDSAYTPAWLFKTRQCACPFGAFCGDITYIEPFICICPQFDTEGKAMVDSLQKKGLSHRTFEDVVLPGGPAAIRKKARLPIASIRDTGLSDTW